MQPVIVMPMHDPTGVMLPLLASVTPPLKELFAQAIVSVSVSTVETQPERVAALHADRFFQVIQQQQDLSVGEDFTALYTAAAASVSPSQVLHLCYIESQAAWQTHPRNYQEIEPMVTLAGQWLFGVALDFAWCHLALQAQQLAAVMPHVRRKDISMVAEMLLPLRHRARTREVDWLAWEDPFVYACDAEQLKRERESSPQETHKRLAYVIPMLELLYQASRREGG